MTTIAQQARKVAERLYQRWRIGGPEFCIRDVAQAAFMAGYKFRRDKDAKRWAPPAPPDEAPGEGWKR